MSRRATVVATMTLIAVLFAVTRVVRFEDFPWFGDEGWYATYAVRISHGADPFLSLLIGKEPLPYWLAAGLIKLGVAPMEAMRLTSVIGAAFALVLTGLIARRLGGDGAALTAAGLWVVLPFFVVYDAIGLPDPLLAALMAGALLLSLRLAERAEVVTAVGLGLVLAALVLTKESGKIALLLVPLGGLYVDRTRARRWALLLAGALAMGGAAWLALRLSTYYDDVAAFRADDFRYPVRSLHDALSAPRHAISGNFDGYRIALGAYLTVPFVVAAAAGAVLAVRDRWRLGVVVCAWAAVPLAAALLLPLQPFPRYVEFAMPPVVALAGLAVVRAAGAAFAALGGRRPAAAAVAGACVLLAAPAVWRDGRVLAHPATTHYPAMDDAQYVTGISAGGVWPAVTREVRHLAAGRPATVVRWQATTWVLEFLLHDHRFRFVDTSSPRARDAEMIVRDAVPFTDPLGDRLLESGRYHEVASFSRPRGGGTVRIYQRT